MLNGEVDAIILTGGMAYGKLIVDLIKEKIGFMAPIVVYPGEDEMLALAQGAIRVLNGEEEVENIDKLYIKERILRRTLLTFFAKKITFLDYRGSIIVANDYIILIYFKLVVVLVVGILG